MNPFMFLGLDVGDKTFSWEWGDFAWYSIRNTVTGNLDAELIVPFWSIAAVMVLMPLGGRPCGGRPRSQPPAQEFGPLPLSARPRAHAIDARSAGLPFRLIPHHWEIIKHWMLQQTAHFRSICLNKTKTSQKILNIIEYRDIFGCRRRK